MRFLAAGTVALLFAACGAATEGIPPEALVVSARDAYVEARSVARSWDGAARLRYVEGEGVAATGVVAPEEGIWRFHYTALDRPQELVVEVSALETASAERPETSPPGYVIGDNALGASWIDSREVVEAIAAAGTAPAGPLSLLLVPTRPAQWVVRSAGDGRWRVHAETGELLSP
ncbi:MAG: hypothetical protein GWM90_28770 [Gemmatimonadetes bacterium]|nr:hypothetical protein [Gemmatimonadota bacterium]NIQ55956.1 hypothetical protein [Gemmatimonadota bacterium]NIU76149.1 hypothetical protein [Gammaproteobacteria bacterium]NIX47919.1 hypothetical protein [Gemmatimonadota bacterium]